MHPGLFQENKKMDLTVKKKQMGRRTNLKHKKKENQTVSDGTHFC